MIRRRLLLALLALGPAACGRRGRLRLPEPEEGGANRPSPAIPTAPPARPSSRDRAPRPAGLEIG